MINLIYIIINKDNMLEDTKINNNINRKKLLIIWNYILHSEKLKYW